MAKIVYVGIPAHGHTNPMLPVLKELVQRGHTVRCYNAQAFREKVAPTGVDFCPLPEPLPTEREIANALKNMIDAALLVTRVCRSLTRFLLDELAREQPDLLIYDSLAMWGYLAARTLGIAQVCCSTTFVLQGAQRAIGWQALAGFYLSAIPHIPRLFFWHRRMAQEFGREHVGGITEYAEVNIVFTSRDFHPENAFIDERFRFVGTSIDPTTRERAPDFSFAQLRDGPTVYISLGTIIMNMAFYRAVFAAFAAHPDQFILAVGRHIALADLGAVPENFIVRQHVPQLDILQRVDAFITHGGLNSVHEGLYYGVPQIVVPQHLEQLLNGKRVAETGAGIVLGATPPYRYGRVTPQELRTALDRLRTTPRYRQNAQRIGATLQAAGGYRRAVAEIEARIEAAPGPSSATEPAG